MPEEEQELHEFIRKFELEIRTRDMMKGLPASVRRVVLRRFEKPPGTFNVLCVSHRGRLEPWHAECPVWLAPAMRQRLHAAALASTASTASTTGTTGTNPSIARTHAAFAKLSEPLRLLGLCARRRRLLRQLCGAESQ